MLLHLLINAAVSRHCKVGASLGVIRARASSISASISVLHSTHMLQGPSGALRRADQVVGDLQQVLCISVREHFVHLVRNCFIQRCGLFGSRSNSSIVRSKR